MNAFKKFAPLFILGAVFFCSCRSTPVQHITTAETKPENKGETSTMPTRGNHPVVLITTSMGPIKIEVYRDKAPISVENFLKYANSKFYDGTIFHRVIPGFMIQGGGFDPEMHEKQTDPSIKNEAGNGLNNEEGTIAMARTEVIDSATSQFFINAVNNRGLNHRDNSQQGFGYAVFGKVIQGLDVVHKIEHTPTHSVGSYDDVPLTSVKIESVRIVEPVRSKGE